MRLPVPNKGLDVLHLSECGLCDLLALMETRRALAAPEAEAWNNAVELRPSEGPVRRMTQTPRCFLLFGLWLKS